MWRRGGDFWFARPEGAPDSGDRPRSTMPDRAMANRSSIRQDRGMWTTPRPFLVRISAAPRRNCPAARGTGARQQPRVPQRPGARQQPDARQQHWGVPRPRGPGFSGGPSAVVTACADSGAVIDPTVRTIAERTGKPVLSVASGSVFCGCGGVETRPGMLSVAASPSDRLAAAGAASTPAAVRGTRVDPRRVRPVVEARACALGRRTPRGR